MRNKQTTDIMREKYKKATFDRAPLTVVCVSNHWYFHHLRGFNEDNIPCSMNATGIPVLRCECLALPASSRLNVLSHHVNSTLPGLLNSLDAWSTASTIKRREELRAIVAKPIDVGNHPFSTYLLGRLTVIGVRGDDCLIHDRA